MITIYKYKMSTKELSKQWNAAYTQAGYQYNIESEYYVFTYDNDLIVEYVRTTSIDNKYVEVLPIIDANSIVTKYVDAETGAELSSDISTHPQRWSTRLAPFSAADGPTYRLCNHIPYIVKFTPKYIAKLTTTYKLGVFNGPTPTTYPHTTWTDGTEVTVMRNEYSLGSIGFYSDALRDFTEYIAYVEIIERSSYITFGKVFQQSIKKKSFLDVRVFADALKDSINIFPGMYRDAVITPKVTLFLSLYVMEKNRSVLVGNQFTAYPLSVETQGEVNIGYVSNYQKYNKKALINTGHVYIPSNAHKIICFVKVEDYATGTHYYSNYGKNFTINF